MSEISRRQVLTGAALAAGFAAVGGVYLKSAEARTGVSGPAGKVVRSGTGLFLDGQPYRMVGFGIWPGAVSTWCRPPNYDGRDVTKLAGYLANIRKTAPHVNTLRVWFFQQFALNGTTRDWSGFDACLSKAAAAGFKVIACLEDNWSYERTKSHEPALSSSWFNGGYKNTVLTKESVPYRQYVQEIVTRYAGDPRIAVWELGNEMNGITQSFVADVSALIKSIDPHTLVGCGEVGSLGTGIYGLPTVDLASYHYYTEYSQTNWQAVQSAAQAAGKPWIMGEYGIAYSGGLSQRAATIQTFLPKVFASANSAGLIYWQYAEQGGDIFNCGDGDPMLRVLDSYVLAVGSTPPPPQLPPPGNLSDANQEHVSWDAVAGADHYRVQLANSGGTVLRDRTTKGTSWTFTPLNGGTPYKWRVAGVKASGSTGRYTAWRNFPAGG
jgi:hypothetical protein